MCTAEERTGEGLENEKVFLLIVVCSAPRNFEARQTIRETWGNVSGFNYPQFAQLHARLRGEYLDPRPPDRDLADFMRRVTGADGIAVASERTQKQQQQQQHQSAAPERVSSCGKKMFEIYLEYHATPWVYQLMAMEAHDNLSGAHWIRKKNCKNEAGKKNVTEKKIQKP